jgi:polynucleotide 5'-hydroxyl-kinase GRC3/NOL9
LPGMGPGAHVLECLDASRGIGVWVSGPAKIVVEKGVFLASGLRLEAGREIIIRANRGASFYSLDESRICVGVGASGSYRVLREGFELIEQWSRIVEDLSSRDFRRIIVVGGVEAGKSTLTAWIHNGLGLPVVEADIGQNELGTPAMVSYASSREPVIALQDLVPDGGFFVGHVSAEKVMDLVVSASARAALRLSEGFVMDTDGFVEGRGAVYKRGLVEALGPDAVIVLGSKPLAKTLRGAGAEIIEAPAVPSSLVRLRSRGERRAYRQRAFASLFAGAKPVVLRDVDVVPLCPLTIAEDQVVYICGSKAYVESRRRPEPPAKWLKPHWARGLIAGLRLRKDTDVLALIEELDVSAQKVVVKPATIRSVSIEGVEQVMLGWIILGENYEEEHLEPMPYPAALESRQARRPRRKTAQ